VDSHILLTKLSVCLSKSLRGGDGILDVFAVGSLEGPEEVVLGGELGDSGLEGGEGLVDVLLLGVLGSCQNPDEVNLAEEDVVAGVDEGVVLVVGIHNAVVGVGGEPEELDLAVGAVADCVTVSCREGVSRAVVLGVVDSQGAVGIDGVAGLFAVAVLED
jgi:hypothetical protein